MKKNYFSFVKCVIFVISKRVLCKVIERNKLGGLIGGLKMPTKLNTFIS